MTKGMTIILGLSALVFVLGAVTIGSVIGVHNDLTAQEKALTAQYKQNQNNYSNMFNKFKEVAAVPAMYTEDLEKVFNSAITKRYGEQGTQAMFQFIQEHNPNFDASLYRQIQQTVEAGRNDFEANQKTLLDMKATYETELGVFPNNVVAGFLGFPKVDLDEYDVVINVETEQAFETKKAGPIKLR